ncbi:hypothetical protein [Streptomyces sp. I05A-00742]|uniref:hypothetical protein n=1 Tax=Streptomyces sp. I05A-00742 TaxID=2732853 RepID=UPI001488322D|nr:hypothetical protein [Streptomyces sp. I05A-00742]
MQPLGKTLRTAAVLGAALTLSLGLSPDARAATGDFTYINVNGDDFTLHNPQDGECFLLISGAQSATNSTDRRATLFSEQGCEGPLLVMERGTSATFGSNVPHGVTFG